ncbi:MAG: DUF4906 domain-containing protein [Rikenellaceae bacterium]|nr:DUF4906 domain-containing protein [Rikenellaceae bacterium]
MKKIRFLIVAWAAGAVAVSCSKTDLRPVPAPGGENDTPVTVSLSSVSPSVSASAIGDPNPAVKAVQPLDEGTEDAEIHDLWAIQYDENGKLVGTPYYTSQIPAGVSGTGGVDYTYSGLSVRLTGSGGKSHTVYLIANTGSASRFSVDNDVPTEADLNAIMERIPEGSELAPDAAGGILMLGVYEGPVSSSAAMSVRMQRLAAKVVLRLKSSLSGFTVTDVQLKNVASGLYYCPEPALGTDFPALDATAGSGSHIDYPAEDLAQAVPDGDYKTFTWYVPENLRKATAAVPAAGDRTPDKTDGKATCIEVTGVLREGENCRKGTLRILLGDLGADGKAFDNFDVRRNTVYTVTADIKGLNEGDYRLTVESFDMSNCGMLSPNGTDSVTFDIRKLTKGWQTTMPALGENADLRAELLWTDNAALATQLEIRLDKVNGLLTLKSAGAAEGNAVVALYNSKTAGSGEVLWSWHAWVTGYKPSEAGVAARSANTAYSVTGGQVHTYGTEFQKANGTSRVIMDRNLGATKTYNGGVPQTGDNTVDQADGLFYQWGRKDPFPRVLGSSVTATGNTSTGTMIPIYGSGGTVLDAPSSNLSATGFRKMNIADVINGSPNTLALAVKTPLLFIYNPDLSRSCDWYAEVRENQNDGLWGDGASKSPYDPCPKGWRVPPFGTWSDFVRDAVNPQTGTFPYYEEGNVVEGGTGVYATNGRLYMGGGAPLAWYPATGFCGRIDGELTGGGREGYCWSTMPNTVNGAQMYYTQYTLNPINNGRRGHGNSVRCVQYVE